MKILGNQVYSNQTGTLSRRDAREQVGPDREERPANNAPVVVQGEQASQAFAEGKPPLRRDVTRISGLSATQKQYELYPSPDDSQLTPQQRKAVNLYSDVAQSSNLEPGVDYISSIDLFV